MFVLDSSGSVDRVRFNVVKEMVVSVISALDIRPNRTRVGLIYFSNNAFIAFNLNDYGQVKQDVIEAIRRVPYLGNLTNTAAALRRLHSAAFQRHNGDRDDVPNIAIVIGDGNSNVMADVVPVEAAKCRDSGIRMIVSVIYDEQMDLTELSTIASRPLSKNLFTGSTRVLLDNITNAIINSTCVGNDVTVSHNIVKHQTALKVDTVVRVIIIPVKLSSRK